MDISRYSESQSEENKKLLLPGTVFEVAAPPTLNERGFATVRLKPVSPACMSQLAAPGVGDPVSLAATATTGDRPACGLPAHAQPSGGGLDAVLPTAASQLNNAPAPGSPVAVATDESCPDESGMGESRMGAATANLATTTSAPASATQSAQPRPGPSSSSTAAVVVVVSASASASAGTEPRPESPVLELHNPFGLVPEMRLEARDRKTPRLVCVATIKHVRARVLPRQPHASGGAASATAGASGVLEILIGFDGWSERSVFPPALPPTSPARPLEEHSGIKTASSPAPSLPSPLLPSPPLTAPLPSAAAANG